MNLTRTVRCGIAILAALMISAGMVFSQNLVINNGSSFGGAGTYNVKGSITTPSLTENKTIGGTVNMNGTAGAQAIGTASTNQTLTFGSLNVSTNTGSTTTTQEVSGVLVSTALAVADGSAFDIQGKTLTISGTSTLNTTGSLDASDGASVVNYNNGGASQTVLGLAYGGTLNLSGAAAKSFTAAGSAATMTHASGDLTVNQNWSVSGSGTFAAIADITGAMSFAAGATTASITTITNISSGSLTNNATGTALSIGTLTSNGGTITNAAAAGGINFTTTATNGSGTIETSGGGNVTFAALGGNSGIIRTTSTGGLSFTGAAANAGAITGGALTGAITFGNTLSNSGASAIVTAGESGASFAGIVTNASSGQILAGTGAFTSTLDFNANVDNNGGTIQLGSNGSATFAANFVNSGTLTLNAASNWTYDGAAQNIAGGAFSYGNLFTVGSATKTALGNISVAGNFDNGGAGDLSITTDLDTYALAVTGTTENTNGTFRFGGLTNGFAPGATTADAGTVIYDADAADATPPASQTIAAGSYYQLQFLGDIAKNMVTNTTVTTGSGVSLGASVAVNVVQTSGTTTLAINSGGLTLAASSALVNDGTVNVTGNLDNSGALTNNGTVTVQ